jgi:plastocyanin
MKGAPTIEVAGRNFAFEPAQLSVDVERFNVAFTAEDSFHTFVIEDAGGDTDVAVARGGETNRGGVELAPGAYVFYCDVPAPRGWHGGQHRRRVARWKQPRASSQPVWSHELDRGWG